MIEIFLKDCIISLRGKVEDLQTDIMALEFQGMFKKAVKNLNLEHCFNRIETPKNNSVNERFN